MKHQTSCGTGVSICSANDRNPTSRPPRSATSALTRSLTLRVEVAVQVGLHHYREQALIDAAAPLPRQTDDDEADAAAGLDAAE